jgi:hypothetical protein
MKGKTPWNKTDTNIECLVCHKVIHIPPVRLKEKYPRKYCSRECSNIDHIGCVPWNKGKFGVYTQDTLVKMSKAHPHKYNDNGFTIAENKRDRVKFTLYIHKQVLERDDYTCQMCKKRGVYLQVDHIQKFADYVEGRFDINNCRTLCMDCHYLITYGKPKPMGVIWGGTSPHLNGLIE